MQTQSGNSLETVLGHGVRVLGKICGAHITTHIFTHTHMHFALQWKCKRTKSITCRKCIVYGYIQCRQYRNFQVVVLFFVVRWFLNRVDGVGV